MSISIFPKSSSLGYENTLVVGPRSGISIPFDFPSWTELRIGMFWTGCNTSDVQSQSLSPESTINVSTPADRWTVGLKTANDIRHGNVGTNFVGVSTNANHAAYPTQFGYVLSNYGKSSSKYIGTSYTQGSDSNNQNFTFGFNAAQNPTTYCGIYVIKFVVSNLGLSNQSITISAGADAADSTVPFDITKLRKEINNRSYSEFPTSMSWNDGTTPYALPDAFYLWNPYYTNSARISVLDVIRIK